MSDPNLAIILAEKAWYVGDYVASVLFGVQISLFIQSSYYLAYSCYSFRKKTFLITYGCLLCLFVGITLAGNQVQGLLMWIVHRDIPGGPEAFLAASETAWYNVFGTAAIMTADMMGNALLMYRCYILLSTWIVVFPALLFIAASAMSILTVVESALPNAFVFMGISQILGVVWVSLSVSFNVLVTSLICGRILVSYLALKRMGHESGARERWSIIAILIESSLPFSVFGIAFAAVYGLPVTNPGSQLVTAMADTWGGIVGISPQLIILRVAMGNAWTKKYVSSGTYEPSMQFRGNFGSETRVMKESKTSIIVNQEKIKDAESAGSSNDNNSLEFATR